MPDIECTSPYEMAFRSVEEMENGFWKLSQNYDTINTAFGSSLGIRRPRRSGLGLKNASWDFSRDTYIVRNWCGLSCRHRLKRAEGVRAPLSDRRIVSEDCRLRSTPTCGASFDCRCFVSKCRKCLRWECRLKATTENRRGERGN